MSELEKQSKLDFNDLVKKIIQNDFTTNMSKQTGSLNILRVCICTHA